MISVHSTKCSTDETTVGNNFNQGCVGEVKCTAQNPSGYYDMIIEEASLSLFIISSVRRDHSSE